MSEPLTLPVLPLRDMVLFPGLTVPIAAGRAVTLRALEAASQSDDALVLVVAQRENVDDVKPEGLYTLGTIARIEQIHRSLAGVQVVLHGVKRGMAMRYERSERGYLEALTREAAVMGPVQIDDPAFSALYREVRNRAAELGQKAGHTREIVQQVLASVDDPNVFADLVAGYLDISVAERQSLLETFSVEERLRRVLVHIQRQISVFEAQQDLQSKVQEELGDRQREIYLREQLKTIQEELDGADGPDELEELTEKIKALDLPPEGRKEVDRELKRLGRTQKESMEAQIIRNYLETVVELPWNERSDECIDLPRAEKILDEDHYALKDVKDRVLEFLAVHQLRLERDAKRRDDAEVVVETADETADETVETTGPITIEPVETASDAETPDAKAGDEAPKPDTARAPILLFVGPPGVGKTSLAKSIARAMGREYVRVSLGGARDEADIRGHRRTYVGAMPGRIIHGLKQAGSKNPVFLLDEIDKLGTSFQGDPAAALLEVLDPAQNDTFTDHYMGIPFDLSEVFFICTANFLENIPSPLRDRMELIEFDGYTESEKLEIAKRYLLPRQLDQNGLDENLIEIPEGAIRRVISEYTRESGVRQLEREIARLSRKVARKIASRELPEGDDAYVVEPDRAKDLLGRPKVHPEKMAEGDQVGVATGMFYTPMGGDIMFVEASHMPGKGKLVLTGQLGDVMKESAQAAWSYARSHADALSIDPEGFERDVHLHVPAGAIPKDGPSAGITMATALVSALSDRPVRHDLAMTGEVTLSGRVLPIGGVKEKILGGVRAGIENFVIPKDNEADLEDLPPEVLEKIEVTSVSELGEVLALALRDASFKNGRLLFAEPALDRRYLAVQN